ncbi:hypothetical protein [Parasitella parasitica]|uniref:Uncharacterized protein n=1 Tax=Parasitella parasitica TaxID=35722 RepID=A0A0B7N7W7_9FUNG|nr:hypothetical protein [Parasitella parasitica]
MPSSFSKFYQSAKSKLNNRRKSNSSTVSSDSTTGKSVRFSSCSKAMVYETYSSEEYDRRSSISTDPYHEGDSLHQNIDQIIPGKEQEDGEDMIQFSEEVMRNTRVNKKQGHYSIAVLVSYRANF